MKQVNEKIDSQLLKGVLTGCMLQLMSQEELYGYLISERLAGHGFQGITNGTIYPLLITMEKKKWIEGFQKTVGTDSRRKYYRVTEEGEQALAHFRNQWLLLSGNVNRILSIVE